MRFDTDLVQVSCPYCGEVIELVVDASGGTEEYIEDCSVCCRPITVQVAVSGSETHVAVRHENE